MAVTTEITGTLYQGTMAENALQLTSMSQKNVGCKL